MIIITRTSYKSHIYPKRVMQGNGEMAWKQWCRRIWRRVTLTLRKCTHVQTEKWRRERTKEYCMVFLQIVVTVMCVWVYTLQVVFMTLREYFLFYTPVLKTAEYRQCHTRRNCHHKKGATQLCVCMCPWSQLGVTSSNANV